MHAGIRVIPCLSARFNMWQASLERKVILYHFDYINKLLQYYYLTASQPPCQISKKPFYTTSGLWLEAPTRQYEPCT